MICALIDEPLFGALNQEDVSMTNEQIKLVQDSFRQVAPIAETAAQLFYARLFELDPIWNCSSKEILASKAANLCKCSDLRSSV